MNPTAEALLKEAFKLNLYEVRVYLALLSHPMNPRQVSKTSSVPLPRVYDTLEALSQKGFVEERSGIYNAVDPASALESRITYFRSAFESEQEAREEAKSRVVKMVEQAYSRRNEMSSDPVLLKGVSSIGSRFIGILQDSKDVIFLVRKAIEVKDTFKLLLESTPMEGRSIRIILPRRVRFAASDKDFVRSRGIELRSYDNPVLDIMVADSRDVMIGVPEASGDEPFSAVAIWVRNPSFAASTRKALEEIWSVSVPTK